MLHGGMLSSIMVLLFSTYVSRFIVLTTSCGIMDHEEARRKHTGGKILGFFYWELGMSFCPGLCSLCFSIYVYENFCLISKGTDMKLASGMWHWIVPIGRGLYHFVEVSQFSLCMFMHVHFAFHIAVLVHPSWCVHWAIHKLSSFNGIF